MLGVAGGRGRRELRGLLAGSSVPSAVLPAAVVAALALTAYLTPDALAVGTTRLAASLGLWAALTPRSSPVLRCPAAAGGWRWARSPRGGAAMAR